MSPSPDTNTASLLVVDDDLVTQARLNAYFSQEGYRVLLAGDGETFWQQLEHAAVDLVLLDINLPGQDGLSLARELRARDPAIGIILLTSRKDDIDKIVGLEVGADDYVTKPFNPRELLARIHAVLRRQPPPELPGAPSTEAEEVAFGPFVLNLATRALTRGGEPVPLTSGEFSVLKTLVRHPRQPLSREKLMALARGREYGAYDRSLDVQVSRLRKLIEADPQQPRFIQTVWGVGYVFVPDGK